MMLPSTQVSPPQSTGLLTRIRLCLALVIAGLLLSGATAFFPIHETKWLLEQLASTAHFGAGTPLSEWLLHLRSALIAALTTAPFLAYETDREGFGLLLFALLFVGPYRDPIRNRGVINFGLLTCAALAAFAFVAGPLRGIPVLWRCVDAALALLCALPLLLCRHYLHLLEHIASSTRLQRSQKVRRLRHIRKAPSGRSLL